MKTLLLFVVVVLSAAAGRAADILLKATVTGTVRTQQIISPTDGRIITKPLNNLRIAQEFGVSPAGYRLVLNVSKTELVLMPIYASSGLQAITVWKFGTSVSLINTKAHIVAFS